VGPEEGGGLEAVRTRALPLSESQGERTHHYREREEKSVAILLRKKLFLDTFSLLLRERGGRERRHERESEGVGEKPVWQRWHPSPSCRRQRRRRRRQRRRRSSPPPVSPIVIESYTTPRFSNITITFLTTTATSSTTITISTILTNITIFTTIAFYIFIVTGVF